MANTEYERMSQASKWSSSTFACCADGGIFCSVALCMSTTTSQLCAKLVPTGRGMFVLACLVFWTLGVLWLVPDVVLGIKLPDVRRYS
jgi:hypothetical protein